MHFEPFYTKNSYKRMKYTVVPLSVLGGRVGSTVGSDYYNPEFEPALVKVFSFFPRITHSN